MDPLSNRLAPSESKATTTYSFALAYRNTLAHYLNLIIPETAHLLEIGSGSGYLLQLLRCHSKVGIEVSKDQFLHCRKSLLDFLRCVFYWCSPCHYF